MSAVPGGIESESRMGVRADGLGAQANHVDEPGLQLRRDRPERDVRRHGDPADNCGDRRHGDDALALGYGCVAQAYLDGTEFSVDLSLTTDAFDAYQNMTGATMDSNTGLLTVTEDQYSSLKSMFFNIGGVSRTRRGSLCSPPSSDLSHHKRNRTNSPKTPNSGPAR